MKNGWRPLALGLGVVVLLVVIGSGLHSSRPDATSPTSASRATSARPTVSRIPTPTPTPSTDPAPSLRPTARPTPKPPGPTPVPTPPVLTEVTLVGAGDIASCDSNGDERTAALLNDIPGTVFTAGDNVYDDGAAAEFASCYDPSWGRHLDRTRPAPGNHDYRTAGAGPYFAYFGARAGEPGAGYYAYDLGSWRIYALNSNCADVGGCDAGSPQVEWLRADLAAHPKACVLAYWHHPLFSSGQHGNNPVVRPLFRALYDASAEIVLAGHDHVYERFAPQAPGGAADPSRGIVEIVVGTGGRSHHDFQAVRPNSLVRNRTTYGVLKLTLGDERYAFEFVPVAGKTFSDSGSGACH